MEINMKKWLLDTINSSKKKAMPILSFPCINLLGITVSELISDSEIQAKGMFEVSKKTNSAATVSFMDLSVEAECFGAQIRVCDCEVPTVVGRIIESPEDADNLQIPKVGSARSGLYIDAIKKATKLISDRPVFAGMIGPFSLAARLMDVTEIMINCFEEPEMVHKVLSKVTKFLCEYAKSYKEAGASGVVIAEPVAGLLDPDSSAEFSAPYVKKIVDAVQDDNFVVIYHNCGSNTILSIESILSTNCAAYHFGNAIDMKEMLSVVPNNTLVMGNIDPAGIIRHGNPETIRTATLELMNECCVHNNFLISSGCDIPPLTSWENIDAFFDAVEEFYAEK